MSRDTNRKQLYFQQLNAIIYLRSYIMPWCKITLMVPINDIYDDLSMFSLITYDIQPDFLISSTTPMIRRTSESQFIEEVKPKFASNKE